MIYILHVHVYNKYRLYTEVKVSTGFIKPRAEGTRFDKSVETIPRCITVFYDEMHAKYSN